MIIYDQELFELVFKEYTEHPSLSFDDCVLDAKIKRKNHEPLWTFDRKFANQSTTTRLVPQDSK